jgi:hypothetical protein
MAVAWQVAYLPNDKDKMRALIVILIELLIIFVKRAKRDVISLNMLHGSCLHGKFQVSGRSPSPSSDTYLDARSASFVNSQGGTGLGGYRLLCSLR